MNNVCKQRLKNNVWTQGKGFGALGGFAGVR